MAVFTCWFGVRTWKPVVVFIETGGILVKLEAFGLQLHQKPPVSMKPPQVSSSDSKPTREYRHFLVRVLMNTVKKKIKNMCVFPMKPFICYFSTKFLPMNTSNFSKYCFKIFPKKKKKFCWNLRWFHKNCSKSKIPWYGDEKIVQVAQFFHHHTRVFLIFNSFFEKIVLSNMPVRFWDELQFLFLEASRGECWRQLIILNLIY